MKPDEILKQMEEEDEDNPKDVLSIKEEIEDYYKKEQQFLGQMPESIQISFFRIYLKDVVEQMAMKYHQTGKGLESLVAKKAKKSTKALMEKF